MSIRFRRFANESDRALVLRGGASGQSEQRVRAKRRHGQETTPNGCGSCGGCSGERAKSHPGNWQFTLARAWMMPRLDTLFLALILDCRSQSLRPTPPSLTSAIDSSLRRRAGSSSAGFNDRPRTSTFLLAPFNLHRSRLRRASGFILTAFSDATPHTSSPKSVIR